MGTALLVVVFKMAADFVRVCLRKPRGSKPVPLCVRCFHAHVQYGAKAERAISCTFSGTLRSIKLDVMYCTDYVVRNAPVTVRAVGFKREGSAN